IDLSKDPLHYDRATRRLQPRGNRGATRHLARPIPAAEERLGADVRDMGRAHRSAHRRTQTAEDRYRQLHLRAHEGACAQALARSGRMSRTFYAEYDDPHDSSRGLPTIV